MALMQLPSELLLQIIENLGSSYFHEDLSRLTLFRRWFDLALPIALSQIKFSPYQYGNLLRQHQQPNSVLGKIGPSLEKLHVCLTKDDLKQAFKAERDSIRPLVGCELSRAETKDSQGRVFLGFLSTLASFVTSIRKGDNSLHELRIEAAITFLVLPPAHWHYLEVDQELLQGLSPMVFEDWAIQWTLCTVLASPNNITTLDLCIYSNDLAQSVDLGRFWEQTHLCKPISLLLPQLLVLRLTPLWICLMCFECPELNEEKRLPLAELVVTLSPSTYWCGSRGILFTDHLKRSASRLASCMNEPRIAVIRIERSSENGSQIKESWDLLKGGFDLLTGTS